jgi:type I restriction enzyme S subunit
MLCDKVYRLKLQADISAAYVEVVLNSPSVLSEIEKLKTGISDSGVNLTQGRFNGLAIPLPPRREQEAIELGVGKQLSIFDEIGRTASANLRRVERLRQAVLKWAFEGKLVDQDPNDEPANKLFARIKVQRGAKSLPDRRQEEQRD